MTRFMKPVYGLTTLALGALLVATPADSLGQPFDPDACIASGRAADGETCAFIFTDQRWQAVLAFRMGPAARAAAQQEVENFNFLFGTQLSVDESSRALAGARLRHNLRPACPGCFIPGPIAAPLVGLLVNDPASPDGQSFIFLNHLFFTSPAEVRGTRTIQEPSRCGDSSPMSVRIDREASTDAGSFSFRFSYSVTEPTAYPAGESGLVGETPLVYVRAPDTWMITGREHNVTLVEDGMPTANLCVPGKSHGRQAVRFNAAFLDPTLQSIFADPDNALDQVDVFTGEEFVYSVLD